MVGRVGLIKSGRDNSEEPSWFNPGRVICDRTSGRIGLTRVSRVMGQFSKSEVYYFKWDPTSV